jgi:hypothetical protein
MKTVNLSRKSDPLHIEAPGCIVNIWPGLTDADGRAVCTIHIRTDQYAETGGRWYIDGEADRIQAGIRVVQTDTPTPPRLALLAKYVSGDDAALSKAEFLRMVVDRISSDIGDPPSRRRATRPVA